MSNSTPFNRSTLKQFLASIVTIKGDLSNITAPPFVLGDYSTVELPQYFADHPALFVAPALEENAEKRALLVLKNFLASLKNQLYAGRREEDGVKKPINAFLGELFLGSWKGDKIGETKLVSEQVSHHPPVTACYLWNEQCGISAEGFTQQEITFNGTVHIKQKGYAITHVHRYDEHYLIPLPHFKVKGFLTGTPYPELVGNYSIVSSTGFISEIEFEGKSLLFGGNKHGFKARLYRADASSETLYTAQGQWNGSFNIQDARTGDEIETSDMSSERSVPITVAAQSEQDPWESRKAWGDVIDALNHGDMKRTVDAKSNVEDGQRQMRRDEEAQNKQWQRVFFQKQANDPLFDRLSIASKESFTIEPIGGIWKVDRDAVHNAKRPFHEDISPFGQDSREEGTQARNEADNLDIGRDMLKAEEQLHAVPTDTRRGSDQSFNGDLDGYANGNTNQNAGGNADRSVNGIIDENDNGTRNDVFSRFLFNDTVTEQWEYVRNITEGQAADSGLWDQYMPYYDISHPNIRCGRGAATSGPGTKTATVSAGSKVGFVVGRSANEPLLPFSIYHNGPGQAYLSRSTVDGLDNYEGDGEWFKIASLGAKNDTYWLTRDQTGMNFTIPPTIPPGYHLLRVEHLYVRPTYNTTQFYIAYAQINVVGPGSGDPAPLVKFPGAYRLEDPRIWVNKRLYEYPLVGLTGYVAPGPSLWSG